MTASTRSAGFMTRTPDRGSPYTLFPAEAGINPLMAGGRSRAEYDRALKLIGNLVGHDELDNPLFKPPAAKISQ